MSKLNDVLVKAANEIGYQEKPDNLTKFGEWYGTNGVAWCYIFVSWVLINSGVKVAKCAYVPDGYNYYKKIGQLYSTPKAGDLAFFCWDGGKIPEHIGFVERVLPDGSLQTIEGNTSKPNTNGSQSNGDGVYRKIRHLSNCLGFGRPQY